MSLKKQVIAGLKSQIKSFEKKNFKSETTQVINEQNISTIHQALSIVERIQFVEGIPVMLIPRAVEGAAIVFNDTMYYDANKSLWKDNPVHGAMLYVLGMYPEYRAEMIKNVTQK
jgi:ABC-type sugar transport system ATPase subunit